MTIVRSKTVKKCVAVLCDTADEPMCIIRLDNILDKTTETYPFNMVIDHTVKAEKLVFQDIDSQSESDKVIGRIDEVVMSEFFNVWNDAVRKQTILDELARKGVFLEELAAQVGRDYDAFDLVCHIAFDAPPLTRRERAERVEKRNVFGKYGDKARAVLDALLWKYADSGIGSMESMDILNVDPLRRLGTPVEIVSWFGGKPAYLAAIHNLQTALYQRAN